MKKKEPQCGNCRFWAGGGERADCRLNPPVVVGIERRDYDTNITIIRWPRTNANEWCGQHQLRLVLEKKED